MTNLHGTPTDTALLAIDDALAAGHATATDADARELQELALALADLSPAPEEQFEQALIARAEAGFPRQPRAGLAGRFDAALTALRRGWTALSDDVRRRAGALVPSRLRRPRRPLLPVLAGAASLLAAIAVSVALLNDDEPARDGIQRAQPGSSGPALSSPSAGGDSAQSEAAPRELGRGGDATTVPEAVPPVPGPDRDEGIAPGERQRRAERTASMTLAAPEDRLDEVGSEIVEIAGRREGFVLSSELSTGDEGTTGGSFELRVPADELSPTLRDLARLGTVRSQSVSADDRTQTFVSTEDRLRTSKAERASLLKRLADADTEREAEAIRSRLDLVGGQITGLRDELRGLRERTSFAAVNVTLERGDGEGAGTSRDGVGGALDDALHTLEEALGIAIRVLAVALPLALIGLIAWLGLRALTRRRRESALD